MFYLKKQKGFTIVETMIVLGVTGVLFVSVSLLISGQTERYRYRDSMYRLQQQVQAQINDVQSGQFYSLGGTGKSNTETIVGKTILFCVKSDNITGCPTDNVQTSFGVGIIKYSGGGEGTYKSWVEALPGGINYIGAHNLNSDGSDRIADTYREPFGLQAKYSSDPGALNVGLYTYSGTAMSGFNSGYGSILCFEGYKRGSLEIGSKQLGNTVKLNLVDSRCD